MSTSRATRTLLLAACLAIAGCEGRQNIFQKNPISGASDLVDYPPPSHDTITDVDLATMISPEYASASAAQKTPITLSGAIDAYQVRIAAGTYTLSAEQARRNTIVGALMAASDEKCGQYERKLKTIDTDTNLFFGGMATLLGGVGAIVTGEQATRTLSGLAGISSGVGAEAQKDVFSNLATSVIIPGIEKARQAIRQDIMNKVCNSPTTYPVTTAIADVMRYHSACSMDQGINAASQSIAQTAPGEVGLNQLLRAKQALVNLSAKATAGGQMPGLAGLPTQGTGISYSNVTVAVDCSQSSPTTPVAPGPAAPAPQPSPVKKAPAAPAPPPAAPGGASP